MPKYNPLLHSTIPFGVVAVVIVSLHSSFLYGGFLNYLTSCNPVSFFFNNNNSNSTALTLMHIFLICFETKKEAVMGISGKIQHCTESSIKMVLDDCNRHHCCVDGVVVVVVDALLVALSIAK